MTVHFNFLRSRTEHNFTIPSQYYEKPILMTRCFHLFGYSVCVLMSYDI